MECPQWCPVAYPLKGHLLADQLAAQGDLVGKGVDVMLDSMGHSSSLHNWGSTCGQVLHRFNINWDLRFWDKVKFLVISCTHHPCTQSYTVSGVLVAERSEANNHVLWALQSQLAFIRIYLYVRTTR